MSDDVRTAAERAVAAPCVCGGRDNPDCERCALVAVARAYLAASPPDDADGWRPIETAPKDGTAVLVYAAEREGLPAFQCVASWHQQAGWCVDELRYATHWRPLPDPPKMDEAAKG